MNFKPNYKEIFDAWISSMNPTPVQKTLAAKRLNVCLGCDYRKEVLKGVKWSAFCGDCGCPLNKKIFSKSFSPCTQGKWEEIDKLFLNHLDIKNDKTII